MIANCNRAGLYSRTIDKYKSRQKAKTFDAKRKEKHFLLDVQHRLLFKKT
jgi:hypothetical protein